MNLGRMVGKQLGLSWGEVCRSAIGYEGELPADLADGRSARPAPVDGRSSGRDSGLSRRKLLFGAALAALLDGREAQAAPPTSATRWLINRITYGWTPAEQLLADQLGYHGYLEHQLAYEAIDDSALAQRLSDYFFLTWQPWQLYHLGGMPAFIVHQLVETTFLRCVFSRRQMYQRMVEFWSDHFHIDINNELNNWIRLVDLRDVIMPHALGKFPDMLRASAQSPSMLLYLNNDQNRYLNINENYARELMELHTLGVDGGYTQQDVIEVARCFTGWSVHTTDGSPQALQFLFYAPGHDEDPKTVLGQSIPAGGGMNDGFIVLDILANHPSTARFVATKLCRRFYSDDPPTGLVDSVAQTYTATGGDIKAMLRTLFNSVDPMSAPLKLKRPLNLFTSAFRATGADYQGNPSGWTSQLRQFLADCGHQPFHWNPPDGFPESPDFWAKLLLPRWNFGALLGSTSMLQVDLDMADLMQGAATPEDVVARIETTMFPLGMTANERNLIRDYVATNPADPVRQREAVGLAVATPSFQWQ